MSTPPAARWPLVVAILLGIGAAAACWVRLAPKEKEAEAAGLTVTLREVDRGVDRVTYMAEITTDVIPEITTVRTSSTWVRWDPEGTEVVDGKRRILVKITVGAKAADGGAKPGFWIVVAGRQVRFVETRP